MTAWWRTVHFWGRWNWPTAVGESGTPHDLTPTGWSSVRTGSTSTSQTRGQLIPWSRIMNGIWITWGKHSWNTNSRGVYTLRGMVATRNGGWMHTTLRHPYEDHQLRFDQHTRPYRAVDALRLESCCGSSPLRKATSPRRPGMGGSCRGVPGRREEPLDYQPCTAAGGGGGPGGSRPWQPLTAAIAIGAVGGQQTSRLPLRTGHGPHPAIAGEHPICVMCKVIKSVSGSGLVRVG